METNSNHTVKDELQTAEKKLLDSNKEIMDFYTKQMNAFTGFYTNTASASGNIEKSWSAYPGMSTNFFNQELSKAFAMPFNGIGPNFGHPFSPNIDQFNKQLLDFNTAMFTNFNTRLQGSIGYQAFSDKYQNLLHLRMEASKNILKTATDAFNKQFDTSLEINKKAIEEMNQQLQLIISQTQIFWFEAFSSVQSEITNLEKPIQNTMVTTTKKGSVAPTGELSNHKV